MERPSLYSSRARKIAASLLAVGLALAPAVPLAHASSWDPTLLVNTESFQVIDDGDATTNIILRFGDTANEELYWDISNLRFEFTDDVHIQNNITSSGTVTVDGAVQTKDNLTINSDNTAADAVLTFGNDAVAETLTFSDTNEYFIFSDDVHATGNLTTSGTLVVEGNATLKSTLTIGGVAYTFPVGDGSASGKVLATNGAGQLVWTDRDVVNETAFDSRYVNTAGDTMTGALTIANGAGLSASGDIVTESNLTLNQDNGATDAVLTFGNDAGVETITFSDSTEKFIFSDDVHTTGNVTASGTITVDGAAVFGSTITLGGVAYTFPVGDGTASGKVLATDSAGQLVWTDRDLVNETAFDARYVNTAGDTMTGALTIANGAGLSASGNIITESNLTINQDNGAVDAVMTFGNDAGVETITFSDTTNNFEFSDDIHTTGTVKAGVLSGTTLNVDSGGVVINGVQYQFGSSQGGNGQVLTNDGNGNLTWSAGTLANGSGTLFFSPEYPHVVYNSPGAASIGQLTYDFDGTNFENHYRWTTSKSTNQAYEIVFQATLPDNFVDWDVAPIVFRYRTSAANADIDVTMRDTANASVSLTGGANLTNSSWTTATITGPEAAGTYTAGENVTFVITVNASNSSAFADVGWIELNFDTSSP